MINSLFDYHFHGPEKKRQKPRKIISHQTKGYVYVIKGIEGYKIGMSFTPEKRAKQFYGELFMTIPTDNMFKLELKLHKMFAKKRKCYGEWFNLNELDIEYLRNYKE